MQKLIFKITINPYSFMNKKLLFSFLTLLGTVVSLKAQRNELGIRLGMSNLVGDIGKPITFCSNLWIWIELQNGAFLFMVVFYTDLILTRIRPLE